MAQRSPSAKTALLSACRDATFVGRLGDISNSPTARIMPHLPAMCLMPLKPQRHPVHRRYACLGTVL